MNTSLRRVVILSAALSSLVAPRVALGDPGFHEGFMARAAAGVSWVGTSEEVGSNTARLGGAGFTWNVSLGWFPLRDFALHLSSWGAYSPAPSVSERALPHFSALPYNIAVAGVGATYFIPNVPIFIGGSLGVAVLTVLSAEPRAFADPGAGWASNFNFGYQFARVGDFSVGVMVQGTLHSNPVPASSGATPWLSTMHLGALVDVAYH